MKKKVGVISIWDIDNYGNRLQNYAMLHAVKDLGYDAYTLKMWPQKKWKRVFQYIFNYDVSFLRLCMEKARNNRKYHFLKFERENITKDRHFFHAEENRKLINKLYDGFVMGSDQIWNPVFLGESYYFGAFADEDKPTVSYAASIGVSELKESDQVKLKKGLATVKKISVREDAAADIIENLGIPRPKVVVDPTMLVSASEWEKLEKKPKGLERNYLLLYYLGDVSDERWNYLNRIANENNLELVILGKKEYPKYFDAGPAEFLYLIHHAKLVCTDSFHGCVFSILFQTPFYIFERENSVQQMNSRIDTLLGIFRFCDRKKNRDYDSYSLECSFDQCKEILANKKEEGFHFLEESLKGI